MTVIDNFASAACQTKALPFLSSCIRWRWRRPPSSPVLPPRALAWLRAWGSPQHSDAIACMRAPKHTKGCFRSTTADECETLQSGGGKEAFRTPPASMVDQSLRPRFCKSMSPQQARNMVVAGYDLGMQMNWSRRADIGDSYLRDANFWTNGGSCAWHLRML